MGMSTSVYGMRDKDGAEHKKMVAVMRACEEASISWPKEVDKYFDSEVNEDGPLQVDLADAVEEGHGDSDEWWDVDLSKLPKGITKIRFRHGY